VVAAWYGGAGAAVAVAGTAATPCRAARGLTTYSRFQSWSSSKVSLVILKIEKHNRCVPTSTIQEIQMVHRAPVVVVGYGRRPPARSRPSLWYARGRKSYLHDSCRPVLRLWCLVTSGLSSAIVCVETRPHTTLFLAYARFVTTQVKYQQRTNAKLASVGSLPSPSDMPLMMDELSLESSSGAYVGKRCFAPSKIAHCILC
jgi:hypothetical protein